MQSYTMFPTRLDGHGPRMGCKATELLADTDPAGRTDAFNRAELLLTSVAACLVTGIERVTPMLGFCLHGVAIQLTGERQDAPLYMMHIDKILVDHHMDRSFRQTAALLVSTHLTTDAWRN